MILDGLYSRSRPQCAAFFAAAAALLLWAWPASAQDAASGSETRNKKHYVSGSGAPRKKQNASHGKEPNQSWAGFSIDLGVYRPIGSHVLIRSGMTELGQFNMTGIHLAATAAYLFQQGRFVIGPRVKVMSGWIESMPLDYTIRTTAAVTVGGEAGYAFGRWYGYAFGGGGAAWVSADRLAVGRTDELVPAYELGAGFRYALSPRWYAKTEVSYTTLGDFRLGADYFDPRPYVAINAGFGFQFASK